MAIRAGDIQIATKFRALRIESIEEDLEQMLELGLNGKVALITGGSDGLGYATAHRLAHEGARVVICGRRPDYLQHAAQTISTETGGQVLGVPADVTQSSDITNLVERTSQAFGGIDILVNNAGASAAALFEAVDDEAWQADIDLKIMAAVRLCRLAIPIMKQRGGGAIINATIVGGKAPLAGALPTTVTRAAGINLTKSLANEYASDNIRVNTVCIGLIESAQWIRRAGNSPVGDFYSELAKRIPIGRVGKAEEYGDLVAFLVSERANFITGTAINLDGGMSAVV